MKDILTDNVRESREIICLLQKPMEEIALTLERGVMMQMDRSEYTEYI